MCDNDKCKQCKDCNGNCGKCCEWVNIFSHDKKPINIHDTIECAGTTVSRNTVNIYYLITRFVFALIITIITLWSLITWTIDGVLGIWGFYITHWGLSVNLIYMWLSTYLHYKVYKSLSLSSEIKTIDELNLRMIWYFTLYFLDISVAISVFVIFLYWALVYDGGDVKPISWNTHGTVGILMFIEWMTSTWQLTYKGAIFLFVTAIGWVLLSIFFYLVELEDANGNWYIYAVIDWGEKPGTAVGYSFVVCLALPAFHLLMVTLKNQIMKFWLNSRTKDEKDFVIIIKDDNNDGANDIEANTDNNTDNNNSDGNIDEHNNNTNNSGETTTTDNNNNNTNNNENEGDDNSNNPGQTQTV